MHAEFFVIIFTPTVNKKEGANLQPCHLSLFQLYFWTVKKPSKYYRCPTALGNSIVTLSVQAVEQLQQ